MCYNENSGQNRVPCDVKIKSDGNNLNEEVLATGSCQNTDGGVFVCYGSDGDRYTFFFKDGSAEYVRTGSQYVRMLFERGKTTRCEIGCGDMKGFFEVGTKKIEISSGESGHRVLLEYESGNGGEMIELVFTVIYK